MKRYITSDMLSDFLEKMWARGIRCEFIPSDNEVKLWSPDLVKLKIIQVFDKQTYDKMVEDIINELKPFYE